MGVMPMVQAVELLVMPIAFLFPWLFVVATGWTVWRAIDSTIAQAKQMHRIPCSNCQFFTNDYRLKCPVHPKSALTEEAIDCRDYHP
uniref:Uncharacterized protein n=1 Tax=Planktothricoides sp. SpSt-374 TaxID=2282167 RepID=A0A7C3VEW1_9CYAN